MFGLVCQCLRQRENRRSSDAANSRRASAVSSSISATPGLLVLRSKRARIRDTAAQYPELEQGMLRIRR